MSRYTQRAELINSSRQYAHKLRELNVKNITHFVTPKFGKISQEMVDMVESDLVRWGVQTKFYKLAHEYYGDSKLWWVIAFFNNMPTDFHAKIGDVILVPRNWQDVYNLVADPSAEE